MPSVPLWIVLLGNMTEFTESKWLLMQTIEKVSKNEKVKPHQKNIANFVYNLICLEERLRGGEKSGEELMELLYKCYQFIRNCYLDYELKKQHQGFDPLCLLGKSLHSAMLCKTLKTLSIEIITTIKLRLGKLVTEQDFSDPLFMLVWLFLCSAITKSTWRKKGHEHKYVSSWTVYI